MKLIREIKNKINNIISNDIIYYNRIQYLTNEMLNSDRSGVDKLFNINNSKVIVSLTTYNKRIYDVYLAIESIMQQTVKPSKIILWLDEKEFTSDNIPHSLILQQKRGLEIKFCANIKSYKKLIPTLKNYSNDIIITIDDDVMYPFDLVERLLKGYYTDPKCIYFTRGHKIRLNEEGLPLPYREWYIDAIGNQNECPFAKDLRGYDILSFPTGIGGILYPPNSLNHEVINEDVFMEICPNADDVWFKVMSLMNGTYSRQVYIDKPFYKKFLVIQDGQEIALNKSNFKNNGNDAQIKAVLQKYNIKFNNL